jgi:hypothetical protein
LHALRSRVHRIPSRVRDDARSAPLWNETVRDIGVIWVRRERKYFCEGGLDRANQLDLVQEI